MARIRSIKPEIRTSEKVCSWPIEVRYFWIMLWGYVDDYGKGRDNARLIKADSYPLDDDITAKDVERWMKILEKDRVIRRYTVEDKQYFLILNWSEHQKPSHPAKSVIPWPEPESDLVQEESGNSPEDYQRVSENGSPEQGAVEQGAVSSRADEQGDERATGAPLSTLNEDFETVWTEYPIKASKKESKTAYKKALKEVGHQEILDAVIRYREDPNRVPKYTKHFSTWLNKGCWADGPLPPRWDAPKSDQRLQQGFDLVQRVAARGEGAFDYDPFEGKAIEQ